ncbi:MAG: hypothetical protein ACP5OU_07845 [Methanothrix sp.]
MGDGIEIKDESSDKNGVNSKKLEKLCYNINSVGRVRDGLLTISLLIYIIGYIIWSWNAWKNNLGQIPALDLQYLIAGIPPLIIVLLIYAIYLFIRAAFKKDIEVIDCFSTLCLAGLKAYWEGTNRRMKDDGIDLDESKKSIKNRIDFYRKKGLNRYLSISIFKAIRISLLMARSILKAVSVSVIIIGIVSILIYIFSIYPSLPQEFGGPCPRFAYLDLTKSDLSNETLRDLLSEQDFLSTDRIIRSEVLDIYYYGADYILLKPHLNNTQRSNTFAIKQSAVKGITWI